MQRKIDLVKAIRIFLAVVDAKSFSAASGKLNLAISAVSKNVSDLEAYYQCKLLNRNTRAMHLTEDGKNFLAEFKKILMQLDELKHGVFVRQEKIAGKLNITSPENAQGLGIDKKISDFMVQNPNVSISWVQQNRHVNLVDEGIDVALRVGTLDDSNLLVQRFSEIENLVVASPSFLQKHGVPEHPEELSDFVCIIEVSNRDPLRWRYMEDGQQKYVAVSGNLELNKGEMVAYFAAQGHGIARLPTFMMQGYLDSGDLIPILQSYNSEPLEISMLYPQARLSNPALNAFIEFIRS